MDRSSVLKLVLLSVSAVALYYVISSYISQGDVVIVDQFNTCPDGEEFDETDNICKLKTNVTGPETFTGNGTFDVQPADVFGSNNLDNYQSLESGADDGSFKLQPNQYPKDCFPKDQLTPAELLPGDANSKWAQSVPAGQGELGDQNFLNAGYHIGVNTVGQTLRNANRQLRSEPPNPQLKVSPWLQTTIEPDINRRPLEIGGCE
jgi:hypothetical protein